jgi:hypothetical protein
MELYLHSPNTPSWRGAQGEHRDNFTFTFTSDGQNTYRTLFTKLRDINFMSDARKTIL